MGCMYGPERNGDPPELGQSNKTMTCIKVCNSYLPLTNDKVTALQVLFFLA